MGVVENLPKKLRGLLNHGPQIPNHICKWRASSTAITDGIPVMCSGACVISVFSKAMTNIVKHFNCFSFLFAGSDQ